MTRQPDSPAFRLGVEQRGIEFIPREQRYGTPLRLFFVWFGVNLSILCLTVGMLGITAGLGLGWCFVALVLGNLIGTFFMAAHAVQGPHLGIPQMIQSRAQFGVLGASLPLIAVLISTTLYASANAILIEGTLRLLLPLSANAAIVLFGAITVLLAFCGYELIHRMATALTVLSGVLFVAVAILLLKQNASVHVTLMPANHFSGSAFILVVTQATAWSLSSAPTVADYSRYLPAEVSSARTFWYTGLGNFLASTLMMMLGAYLAASFPEIAGHSGTGISGLFGPAHVVAAVLITANLLQVNIMSLYSAYMSSTTIVSSLRRMRRVTLSYKLGSMLLLMGIATSIALATRNDFDAYFADLLAFLVYTLIPWSAINLVDFYWVRRGRYDIDAIFDVNGIYGRIRWRTILIYLFSIVVQIPFVSLSFYRGPIAQLIGADIAWAPGTLVPALLYWLTHASVRRSGHTEVAGGFDRDGVHPGR